MELRLSIGHGRDHPLYSDLALAFDLGTAINIVGDNGCGKSTLLRTIAGFIPPLKGSVPQELADGCSLISDRVSPPSEVLVSDLISLVGQDFERRLGECAPAILGSIGQLLDWRVSDLSTGQRRLVEIALASPPGRGSSSSTRRSAASTTGAGRPAWEPSRASRASPCSTSHTSSKT